MKKRGIGLIIAGLVAMPLNIKANVGVMTIENSNLKVGETKNINVLVSDNVASADGFVTSDDESCIEIVNVSSPFGSNNYFATIDLQGNVLTKAATITIKGLKQCSTTIKISNASIGSENGKDEDRNLTFVSNTITVTQEEINNEKIEEQEIQKEEQTIITSNNNNNNRQQIKVTNNTKTNNTKTKKKNINSKKIAGILKYRINKLFKLL